MFKLHVMQAAEGDALLIEAGTPASRHFTLVDAGPGGIYPGFVKAELAQRVGHGGNLDLVVVSHVDGDHILGVLDLLVDIQRSQAVNETPPATVGELWHNSFSAGIDPDGSIFARMQSLQAGIAQMGVPVGQSLAFAIQGIAEGDQLSTRAAALALDVNAQFPQGLITVENAGPPRSIGGMRVTLVGPTREQLDGLRGEWEAWVDKQQGLLDAGHPHLASYSDGSKKNLSSITLLAEADGRSLLLTGDARGDHLIEGLLLRGLEDATGRVRVDVLKVPHHGSDRNVTRGFFQTVVADTYVISADGKNDNPDYSTLKWIVETAHADNRPIRLVCTNETESTQILRQQRPPQQYGYRLDVMPQGARSITVDIA